MTSSSSSPLSLQFKTTKLRDIENIFNHFRFEGYGVGSLSLMNTSIRLLMSLPLLLLSTYIVGFIFRWIWFFVNGYLLSILILSNTLHFLTLLLLPLLYFTWRMVPFLPVRSSNFYSTFIKVLRGRDFGFYYAQVKKLILTFISFKTKNGSTNISLFQILTTSLLLFVHTLIGFFPYYAAKS